MASGIVYAFLNDQKTLGQVQMDETQEIVPYSDKNFPNTGLNLNSPCTYDLVDDPSNPGQYMATNLQPIPTPAPTPTTITGPYTGDLNAGNGTTFIVTGSAAVVTGNIIINGGTVIVEQNAQVNATSAHSVIGGVLVARKGGYVKGTLNVDGGGSLKIVNKGKLTGGINVSGALRVIVGNDNGGGIISGDITISKTRKVTITSTSSINCG